MSWYHFIFLLFWLSDAAVQMPAWFGDNMVLQSCQFNKTQAVISGRTTKPQETVTVTVTPKGNTYTTPSDNNGMWYVQLQCENYSVGLSTISAQGQDGDPVVARDVSWGEVYFCGGQSNMVYPVSGAFNATWELDVLSNNSNFSGFRFFTALRNYSQSAQFDLPQQGGCDLSSGCNKWWTAADAYQNGLAKDFSAVCYLTAKYLQQIVTSNAPVGLVQVAWSGTRIEAWMPSDVFNTTCKNFTVPSAEKEQQASGLYNAMIHPLATMSYRAAFWYQGEANSQEANVPSSETQAYYACMLQALISSWRNDKMVAQFFPFITVQLPPSIPATENQRNQQNTGREEVRLAQAESLALPNTGYAVTIDLGGNSSWGWDHPPNKREVARRVAMAAAKVAFNAPDYLSNDHAGVAKEPWKSYWRGPVFSGAQQQNGTITLEFEKGSAFNLELHNVTGINSEVVDGKNTWDNCTLCCPLAPPFDVTFDSKTWTTVAIESTHTNNHTVILTGLPKPALSVRYAWWDYVQCTVVNGAGLPLAPFVYTFSSY